MSSFPSTRRLSYAGYFRIFLVHGLDLCGFSLVSRRFYFCVPSARRSGVRAIWWQCCALGEAEWRGGNGGGRVALLSGVSAGTREDQHPQLHRALLYTAERRKARRILNCFYCCLLTFLNCSTGPSLWNPAFKATCADGSAEHPGSTEDSMSLLRQALQH